MTEFEINVLKISLSELSTSNVDNFLTLISIYLTVVSAYLFTVYVTDFRLSKLQLVIITVLYSLVYLFISIALVSIMAVILFIGVLLVEADPSIPINMASSYIAASLGAGVLALVYIATIWFMWSVRKGRKNNGKDS